MAVLTGNKGKADIVIPADPYDAEDRDVSGQALETALIRRDLRRLRKRLGLSQEAFAQRYHIAIGTLRDWEQGRKLPPTHSIAYIKTIIAHPDLVAKVVG